MTDISVHTTQHHVENRSWLLGPHGTESGTTPSVTLDLAKFPVEMRPNGFIPSGTVIAKVTATGLYGPYDDTATDGRDIEIDDRLGILFATITVNPGSTKAGAARVVHGFVRKSKLPFQTGPGALTAEAITGLRLIHFTA